MKNTHSGYFWEIVLANYEVFKLAFHPNVLNIINPKFVQFQSSLKGDVPQFIFAQSITLTPGTITLSIKDGIYKVHALNDDAAKALPGQMEQKILTIFLRKIIMDNLFLYAAIVLIFLMILLVYRIMVGPTVIDRILAVNVIGTKSIVLLVLMGLLFNRIEMFIDIAIGYGLLNFIASQQQNILKHKKLKVSAEMESIKK